MTETPGVSYTADLDSVDLAVRSSGMPINGVIHAYP